jgi:hypothetical protein
MARALRRTLAGGENTMRTCNRIIPVLAVVVLGSVACSADEPSTKRAEPKKALSVKPPPAEAPPLEKTAKPAPEPKAIALTSTAPAKPPSLFDHAPAPQQERSERLTRKTESGDTPSAFEEDGEDFREVTPGDVKLVRFVLATEVSDREPLGESEVFPADTPKIFAFLQFDNRDEPYEVSVHFESVDGPELPYGIDLAVKTSPGWRTWAYTRVRREPGMYRAVVRTLDGQHIDSREFEITDTL